MKIKAAALHAPATGAHLSPAEPASRPARADKPRGWAGFKTILVPVDFSEGSAHAVEVALGIAEASQGRLIFLHIVEPPLYPGNYLANSTQEDNAGLVETARERLSGLSRKSGAAKVPTEIIVRLGRAPLEIPDTARAVGADLIVLSAHGQGGANRVPVGSTAERVLLHAHCAVLKLEPTRA